MEKVITPIKESPAWFDSLEKMIADIFREQIYIPLLKDIKAPQKVLKNSREDLLDAIQKGRISFTQGRFTGKFGSQISKELKSLGATFMRSESAWRINLSKLPVDVKAAISGSAARFEKTFGKINQTISQMNPEIIADKLKSDSFFDKTIFKIDTDIKQTLRNLIVTPELPPERRAKIAAEYTNNMKLWIKDWTEKEIITLRKEVEKEFFKGYRYEDMVKLIERRYQVGRNKAKFLARQETSLLMVKFKESRYTDAGIKEYIWGCVVGSPNHPVRPMHKKLEGKKFRWDDPPITAPNGARNNPGQDYNCRCFAKPVVKF